MMGTGWKADEREETLGIRGLMQPEHASRWYAKPRENEGFDRHLSGGMGEKSTKKGEEGI